MNENTIDLAIVRNRLMAGRLDSRDEELLRSAYESAGLQRPGNPYLRIVRIAIEHAFDGIRRRDFEKAAREIDLIHNIPLSSTWSTWDEEYFLKGAIVTYLEDAPVDRSLRPCSPCSGLDIHNHPMDNAYGSHGTSVDFERGAEFSNA